MATNQINKINTSKDLSWDVKSKSITVDRKVVNGFKAIVRDDNGDVLSVCNSSYRIFTNKELIQLAAAISNITGFDDIVYSEVKEGRITLSYLKNLDKGANIAGFPVNEYFVIGNSFNGQTGLFLGTSHTIIRCMNSFSKIFQNIRIRHTEKLSEKIDQLLEMIEKYKEEKRKMITSMEKFTKVPIDQKIIEDCIKYVFNLNGEEKVDKEISTRMNNKIELVNNSIIIETAEIGNNLFGLFSGFTHFTSNIAKQTSKNAMGNLFGGNNIINQRAFQFAEAIIK